jgi:hypothetical protein
LSVLSAVDVEVARRVTRVSFVVLHDILPNVIARDVAFV